MGNNRSYLRDFSPLLWFCLFTLIGYIIYNTKTFNFNDLKSSLVVHALGIMYQKMCPNPVSISFSSKSFFLSFPPLIGPQIRCVFKGDPELLAHLSCCLHLLDEGTAVCATALGLRGSGDGTRLPSKHGLSCMPSLPAQLVQCYSFAHISATLAHLLNCLVLLRKIKKPRRCVGFFLDLQFHRTGWRDSCLCTRSSALDSVLLTQRVSKLSN